MIYAKFDAYSTWIEKNIADNEITPKMGFGFRYKNYHHGFDFAFNGQLPKEFTAMKIDDTPYNPNTQTYKGTQNYFNGQLTYLYYASPVSRSTFYLGAGGGADRHSIEIKKENIHDYFGSISGLLLAGYQFHISDSMKSFLQIQASQPAFFYEKIADDIYGLSQVNHWLPTFSMSLGVGF